MIRFVIPILPYAVNYFLPLVLTFVIIGLFYTSFSTTRQLDLKKIIAYSSVGHMGFVILGLFTTYVEGLVGSIFLMLGHGIVSSALFLSIGILYDRYHTRNLTDLKSLVIFMPLFGICFLIFTLANISFPGTFNFIAEMSILIALAQINLLAAICSIFSILFILIYAF
jgi:NADH-quinone oxidoreductase subunit M